MNTKKNKLNSLLKIGLLFFGASILLWNCEKQNFEPGVQTSKSPFKQKFVTLSEIPRVKQLLPKKLKSIYQRKTVGLNDAIFDESNILEVIDTLNNANYSFSFLLPTAPKGQLFNLIIGKNAYGELNTPFVLKYTCEEAYVDEFIANNYDFGHFKGTISLHKYTDYFEKDYFSKTTNHDCTEFDQFGDPIPCDINPVDGTSTGGGPGVNPGGSGTGATSGNPTGGGSGCTSTYSWWCAAGGTGPHSVESCGAGTGGILIIDISCAFQNKNTTDCPPCTTSIDGGIGINTISILTMRVTLKKVLNLRGAELAWVAKSDNNAAVKAIYTFLQRNEVDGVYFPEAVSFADLALKALMNNGEVDWIEQVILESNFVNEKCLKSVYDKMGKASKFKEYIQNFEATASVADLRFSTDNDFGNNNQKYTNAMAITNPPLTSNEISIVFNTDTNTSGNIKNKPDVFKAVAMIHEIIHAEMYRKMLDAVRIAQINQTTLQWDTWPNSTDFRDFVESLENKYFGIFNFYTQFEWNTSTPSSAQHQLMADRYRNVIKQALTDYDSTLTDAQKEALSWLGLNEANIVAWQNYSGKSSVTSTLTNIKNTFPNGCN